MIRLLFFSFLCFFFGNCNSQPNFSTVEKIKLHDQLFFAKQPYGYAAITGENELLFPTYYDIVESIGNKTFKYFRVKKRDKYGLIDLDGIEIFHPEYEEIMALENKTSGETFLKMKYNDKWGVMIFPGEIKKVACVYDEIGTFGESDRLLWVKKDDKYGFLDLDVATKNYTTIDYDSLEEYKKEGAKFSKNGRTGILRFEEPSRDLVEYFDDEKLVVLAPVKTSSYAIERFNEGDKYGLRNRKDKQILVPNTYSSLIKRLTHNGVVYMAKKDGKAGIINAKNKVIVPLIYKGIADARRSKTIGVSGFGDEYSIFYKVTGLDGKVGVIDLKNQVLIPLIYDRIVHSRGNNYTVIKDDKWGIFNIKTQSFNLKLEWEDIRDSRPIGSNTIVLKKDGLKGLADLDGRILTPPISTFMHYSIDRHAYALRDQRDSAHYWLSEWGDVISPKSKIAVIYESFTTFSIRITEKDSLGKFEYIDIPSDINGQRKYPYLPGRFTKEYANLICFRQEGKIGLYDKYTKKMVLPNEYESMSFLEPFTNRLKVKKNGKWGIIDLEGKFIIPNKYDGISIFNDIASSSHLQFEPKRFLYRVTLEDKAGIIDYKGDVWVEPKYRNKFLTFMMDGYRDYIVVFNEAGKHGLYQYKNFTDPNEYFDNIYTEGSQLIVVKDGEKRKARITKGNFVEYE